MSVIRHEQRGGQTRDEDDGDERHDTIDGNDDDRIDDNDDDVSVEKLSEYRHRRSMFGRHKNCQILTKWKLKLGESPVANLINIL